MADANIIFNYNLTDETSLTFFDEQVSAFWDIDKSAKAIHQGEDKLMPTFESGLKIKKQPLEYSLKTPVRVEGDFEFTMIVEASSLGTIPLFTTESGGSVMFTPSYLSVYLDRANSTKIVYPAIAHKGGIAYITIARVGTDYTVVIATSNGTVRETVKGTDLPFDISSLFGGMMGIEGKIIGIEMFDAMTEATIGAETTQEVVEEEETIEDMVEEADETHEETQDPVEEAEEPQDTPEEEVVEETEETQNTDKMTPFDKLLKEEVALLADYEGLATAFNLGKPGRELDAKTIQGYVEKNEKYLIKIIYYALLSIKEYQKQDHTFLYQRAKYIAPMFGKAIEEEEETKELEYGFKTDQEYSTFEFGKISNANLTNKMLVKLLMEEYSIWKDEIVKL